MTDWLSKPQAVGACSWSFPPPSTWPDDDLICVGGDLAPATIVAGYRRGLFPMPLRQPVAPGKPEATGWWSPHLRGVLPLDRLRVTRSMRQSAKHFDIRIDTCFDQVVRGCANPSRSHGWISDDILVAYTTLHQLGWAHSVEAFDRDGRLAGGLYGVRIERMFAGESMFHVQRDASKVALMSLVELMRASGMTLLDVQWRTDYLASLGAIEIPRRQYLDALAAATHTRTSGA